MYEMNDYELGAYYGQTQRTQRNASTCVVYAALRAFGWKPALINGSCGHRRKLLLGPGAQAPPHFYDHTPLL